MYCPKCARQNPDTNKFCNGCGASLIVSFVKPRETPAAPPPPPRAVQVPQPKAPARVPEVSSADAPTIIIPRLPNLAKPAKPTVKKNSEGAALDGEAKSLRAPFLRSPKLIVIGIACLLLVGAAGFKIVSMSGSGTATNATGNKNNQQPSANSGAANTEPRKGEIPDGMVYVPGGTFKMGCDDGDDYERPGHEVTVKPFYIDRTEVTCEEYRKFLEATGHKPPESWSAADFPNGEAGKPVTGVTWDDAAAYAKWKNKRLPTEEEWEFAARGTDGRIYPWGNEWKPEMANAGMQRTSVETVGTFRGASPFGCLDMAGNAWEWTASDARAYPGGREFQPRNDPKIIRGGYFKSKSDQATVCYRRSYGARDESDYANTGFRCVSKAVGN
jgi:formylglycine-generating enzyme required for sulfatase activity